MIPIRIACVPFVVSAVCAAAFVGQAGRHIEHPAFAPVARDMVYRSLPGWRGTLDVYRPSNATGRPPTVVFIHGGGIPKERVVDDLFPYLEWGFQVVSVEYHWDAEGSIAIEDCRCALRWISAHREDYQIDMRSLIVTGNSAGGHLALMLECCHPTASSTEPAPVMNLSRWRRSSICSG